MSRLAHICFVLLKVFKPTTFMMYLFPKIGLYNMILVLYNFYINEDISQKILIRYFMDRKFKNPETKDIMHLTHTCSVFFGLENIEQLILISDDIKDKVL